MTSPTSSLSTSPASVSSVSSLSASIIATHCTYFAEMMHDYGKLYKSLMLIADDKWSDDNRKWIIDCVNELDILYKNAISYEDKRAIYSDFRMKCNKFDKMILGRKNMKPTRTTAWTDENKYKMQIDKLGRYLSEGRKELLDMIIEINKYDGIRGAMLIHKLDDKLDEYADYEFID